MRHTTSLLALCTLLLAGTGYACRDRLPTSLANRTDMLASLDDAGSNVVRLSAEMPDSVAAECGDLLTAHGNRLILCPDSLSLIKGDSGQVYANAIGPRGGRVNPDSIRFGSADPGIATVDTDGVVTGVAAGRTKVYAMVTKTKTSPALWDSAWVIVRDTVTPPPVDTTPKPPPAPADTYRVTITGDTARPIPVGRDRRLVGSVTLRGAVVDSALAWLSLDPAVASVAVLHGDTARVQGLSAGTARITASAAGAADTTVVTVTDTATAPPPDTTTPPAPDTTTPPPLPPPSGGTVTYPSPEVAFILGPQLKAGSAANPWPWFDQNEIARGLVHCQAFPTYAPGSDQQLNGTYYDLGLTLYLAYYRSGDSRFLSCARQVTDIWWQTPQIASGTGSTDTGSGNPLAPRNVSLGGLMLRALDGRPEMWPWITQYVRSMDFVWLDRARSGSALWYGVRDGGYMLLYTAWLAGAHPDPAVRAEMKAEALSVATQYYARLQQSDGGWYWQFDDGTMNSQPFMIGLLLDGMIATHRLTGDATVAASILRGVDWLWAYAYRGAEAVSNVAGATWRGMWYGVRPDHTAWGTMSECYCGDGIREVRQLNATTVHAWGYAYLLTGDPKYRTQGDEVFAATYGHGGPLSDAYYGLADFRAKEYNESYRSGARYLAWRAGR